MIMINVALDAMGMAVILTLMVGAVLSNQMEEKRGRMVILLLALIFVQQASDGINWLCEAKPAYSQLLLFVNFIIFTGAEVTALVFYHYVLSLITCDKRKLRGLSIALTVLCMVYVALNLYNLTSEVFYGVDENGCYFRGPLYLATHIYHFMVMILGVVLALRDKGLSRRHKLALFTYAFLPVAAVVFQLFFYGLSALTYCAMTVSMLLIYVTVHLHSVARLEQTGAELTRTRKAYQETLYDAETDDLTGLLMRKVLVRQVESALAGERTTGCALWMLDLDRFKDVNDQFGHAMGDQVLKAVSARLEALFPDDTPVARFGGDEFCVFQPEVTLNELYHDLRQALNTLDFICENSDKKVMVAGSIGAAFLPADGVITCEAFFEQADQALYTSKRNGRHQYSLTEL